MSFSNPTLVMQDEPENDMPCGFDFEGFTFGYDCQEPATKVLVDTSDNDFHWAHLCPKHAQAEMERQAVNTYDCAYCPLGGVGEPVMVDGFPAHPDCAKAVEGHDPAAIRAEVTAAFESGEVE